MQLDLTSEFSQLDAELRRVGANLPRVVEKGITDATATLFKESRTQLSKSVYDKPETTVLRRNRKTGRVRSVKLWKRTSQLLRKERYVLGLRGADSQGLIYNRTPYAAKRHDLTYPAKTQYATLSGRGKHEGKKTSLKTKRVSQRVWRDRMDRTAHWRDDALRLKGEAAANSFRGAIEQAVRFA